MDKFFGKKKTTAVNSVMDTVIKLKGVEDVLMKKQAFLEVKIERELATAKSVGLSNKRAALQALARKKRFEKQLQQIDGTLTTIEFQIEALENASTNNEILNAMKLASSALKDSHQKIDIDKVNDIMDDIQEQQEIAKEISNAISNPVGFGHDFDDDELLAELELLQAADLERDLLNINATKIPINLPDAPSHVISGPSKATTSKGKKEDDELEELKNWAS